MSKYIIIIYRSIIGRLSDEYLLRLVFTVLLSSSVILFQSGGIYAISRSALDSIIWSRPFYDASASCSPGDSPVASSGNSTKTNNIFILGDSITVIAKDGYNSALTGVMLNIDASYGRGLVSPGGQGTSGTYTNNATKTKTGIESILDPSNKDNIEVADTIIIALGTNDNNLTSDQIKLAVGAIKNINSSAKIYWIDTATISDNQLYPERPGWVQSANTAIHGQSSESSYSVIPWFTTVFPDKDPTKVAGAGLVDSQNLIRKDEGKKDVHPTSAGIEALANIVSSNVASNTSVSGESSSSSSCCVGGGYAGGLGSEIDGAVMAIAYSPINATWGIPDSTIENYYLNHENKGKLSYLGVSKDNISEVTAAIKAEGVSPVFLYLYALNEGRGEKGHNQGFINHTNRSGDAITIAREDAKYLYDGSQNMNSTPSWVDVGKASQAAGGGKPVDVVPPDIIESGNQDFQSMPAGTIGRAYIPATAAATWEVYYPPGLLKENNLVQDYGSPLKNIAQNIKELGGDSMAAGGSFSGGCSGGSSGVGLCTPITQSGGGYSKDQLKEFFGDPGTSASDNASMKASLVDIDFLGHTVKVHKIIAPCLKGVASEIQSMSIDYTIRSIGCYRFDSDNGSSNIGLKSYHTYGAACDINPDTNPFIESGADTAYDMPVEYIKAFANHGFTWGGDWSKPKDYMHFQFDNIKQP